MAFTRRTFVGKMMSGECIPVLVQSLSHVWLFVTPWTVARQASLSFTNSRSLLKLRSIELVMLSNRLILCLLLLLLPSIFPRIRVFSNELLLCIRWPKYWSFSFSISPSNEYSGLISFGIDWFYLFAVQGSFKSLLQHHSLKRMNFECLSLFRFKMAVEWRWFASFRGHDRESVINLLGTHLIAINRIPRVADRQEATKIFSFVCSELERGSHSLSIFICTFGGAGWRREFHLTLSHFQRDTLVFLGITFQVSMVHWSSMTRNNSRIGGPGILHMRKPVEVFLHVIWTAPGEYCSSVLKCWAHRGTLATGSSNSF